MTQNEVDWTQTAEAHRLAQEQGAGVIHNTAPAHGLSAAELALIDVLVANEHELAQAAASATETGLTRRLGACSLPAWVRWF